MTRIRKAIFPVAGLGTRFLPATKSVPKEMLPLVDRPLIQYAMDEAREAGIEEFIFVTSGENRALEGYLAPAPELEATLAARGKSEALASVRAAAQPGVALRFARQGAPLGLGHAVRCAAPLIGDEPFAVLLPDDVIAAKTPCLRQMVDAHARTGGAMIAVADVPREKTASYGVLDVAEDMGRLVAVRGMVEKPAPEAAPSTLAVIGRYILTPGVMAALARIDRGAGGEYQLTDAIRAILPDGAVYGYRFEGERFDCGSVDGFVDATVAFAAGRRTATEEHAAKPRATFEKAA